MEQRPVAYSMMLLNGTITVDDPQCSVVKDVEGIKYQRQILLCQMGTAGAPQQPQTSSGKFHCLHILCVQQFCAAGIKDPVGEPCQHDHGQHGKTECAYNDLGFQVTAHSIGLLCIRLYLI